MIFRPRRRRPGQRGLAARLLVLPVLIAAGGCGGGDIPPDVPTHRPSDGLLGDGELQAVVALQTRRDGTGLVALLGDARPAVRARAAFALASVQDTSAVSALVGALQDTDPNVRRDAAFALGQSHVARAVEPLAQAFAGETGGEVRLRILEALGKLPGISAATTLMELEVGRDEEAARTLALARLGAVGGVATEETQNALLARLDHSDASVRQAAAYYFGRMPVSGPWAPHAPRVRQALDGYRRDAPEAMYLVQALGKLADPQDAPRVREWLADARDWRVRANAATALAALPPDPTNRERLLAALDDPSPLVSDQAAQGLARGSALPSELPRIEAWIREHPERRAAIGPLLVVLAQADDQEFVLAWVDALAPDDRSGWSVGLPAVAALPGNDAVDRLFEAARSDIPSIQGPAVGALAGRWRQDRFFQGNVEPYFRLFSEAVTSGSVQAATRAAGVLADPNFLPLGSVDVLSNAFRVMVEPRDLEAMMAVLEALGASGSPDALPVVREALGHDTPAIRAAAARALAALGGEAPAVGESGPAAEADEEPQPVPAVDWSYLAGLGAAPRWILETDRGRVVVQLDPEEAPLTVQTLARLTQEGRYDGVPFHRVVPNFVVQGGDFASGDGFGGPGFTITSEFTEVPFLRGGAGMASAGKDTEGSQFFITHSMQPHLNGSYTTFGWVVSGMDAVDRLDVGDKIVRATVEPGG